LFGEHYVVYGASALAVPIEPKNKITFEEKPGEKEKIHLYSKIGRGIITKSGFEGEEKLFAFFEVAKHIGIPQKALRVKFEKVWGLKGVGTSASLYCGFAAGLYRLNKNLGNFKEKVFQAAQKGELIAHQKKASGIDAKTIAYGLPIIFKKKFLPEKYIFRPLNFKLDLPLFLIDTNKGKKDGTAKMLRKFASKFHIKKNPSELSEEERKKICEEYETSVWKYVKKSLKDPVLFGKLMNENQRLLKLRGVSSKGIEKAIDSALSLGCIGAKLTGGGGEGGAIVALCKKEEMNKIMKKIYEETGFRCFKISIAKSGIEIKNES
jgi:mevalonate kinase